MELQLKLKHLRESFIWIVAHACNLIFRVKCTFFIIEFFYQYCNKLRSFCPVDEMIQAEKLMILPVSNKVLLNCRKYFQNPVGALIWMFSEIGRHFSTDRSHKDKSFFFPHLVLFKTWWLWLYTTNKLTGSFCFPFGHISKYLFSFISLAPKPLCDTIECSWSLKGPWRSRGKIIHSTDNTWAYFTYALRIGMKCYLLSPIRVTVDIRKSSVPYHSCSPGNHSVKMSVWHLLHGGEFICTAA